MANNEILPFAGADTGNNLLTQAEYNADSQRPIGNQPGVARSKLVNKVLRQTSLIASAIAQYFANRQSNDITDSLSAATLAGYMLNAIGGDTQKNSFNSAIAAGTADAITASYTPAVAALTNGLSLFVRATAANTSTTPTFTPNSGVVTAKAIVKGANQALVAGDIAGAGHWLELQYDSTLDRWVLQNPAYGINNVSGLPRNYLSGMTTATNAGAATTKIDIAVGKCRSDDDTADIVFASTLTKQLNASWSAGNNGGLDAGAVAANTGYHVWAIYDPTSGISDALFSTSATSPTMPSGYTKKRRIGWIRTDGSSLIKGFTQIDDTFILKTPGLDVNGSAISAGAGALYTLPVPGGIKVTALFNLQSSGPDAGVYVHSPDADAMYPPTTPTATPPLSQLSSTNSNPEMTAGYCAIPTNASSQVRVDASSSWPQTIYLGTLGWVDTRGRLS